jgi:hypothetical protein
MRIRLVFIFSVLVAVRANAVNSDWSVTKEQEIREFKFDEEKARAVAIEGWEKFFKFHAGYAQAGINFQTFSREHDLMHPYFLSVMGMDCEGAVRKVVVVAFNRLADQPGRRTYSYSIIDLNNRWSTMDNYYLANRKIGHLIGRYKNPVCGE